MPKRHHENKTDKWRRKLRKYEQKLYKERRSLSFEDDRDSLSLSPSPQRGQTRDAMLDNAATSSTAGRSCELEAITTPTRVATPSLPSSPARHAMPSTVTKVPLGIQRAVDMQPEIIPSGPPLPTEHELPYLDPECPLSGVAQVSEPLEVDSRTADPELLQALGMFETETAEWGRDILNDLAKRWDPILRDGLKKEIRDDILKKYLCPKNCSLMKPPVLNPEISTMLNESARNRDARITRKQAQLGCAFSILGQTMSHILTKSIETSEVLSNLSDMAKILADSHYSETETRRSLLTPMVDKTFIEPFKDRKRDSQLFGDKLGDFIKNSRGIQKTGKLIQPTAIPSSTNLNLKGPASRYQQQRSSRLGNRTGETRPPPPLPPPRPAATSSEQPCAASSPCPASSGTGTVPQASCSGIQQTQAVVPQGNTSPTPTPFPGSECFVREAFSRQQVPPSALNVMMSSLSKSTKSQYTSSFKMWWQYCQAKSIDPIIITVYSILDFLSECSVKGSSYGTLNTHRSALSLISGNKVGEDERVKRFFKGIFKMKPSFPKYHRVWDPNVVLNYLADMYPNESLTLEQLNKKLVVLLALATGQRCQTLALIKISNINIHGDRVIIVITDIIKTSGIGKSQPILDLPFFRQRRCVCPAETLLFYKNITASQRSDLEDRLILTYKRPYHAVSSQTISRWIKQTLAASGIDTAIFSAHSTRHASTSAAQQAGVSVDTIRRAAGWTEQSAVFANFYKRPLIVDRDSFINALFN